jgi:hypothetical protein
MAGLTVERYFGNETQVSRAREAISELFLDTELQESNYEYIARVLRETDLPLDELERIYQEEVAPALYRNLNVTAGVWAGFDQDWLAGKIKQKKKWIEFFKKNHTIWNFYKAWVTRDTVADWKRIRKALEIPGTES